MKQATLRLAAVVALWMLAIALVRCAAPGILGGETVANTTHPCPGRAPCGNAFDCPPYANPTGPCEWRDEVPTFSAKKPDAGHDAGCKACAPTRIAIGVCLGPPLGPPNEAGVVPLSTVPCDGGP